MLGFSALGFADQEPNSITAEYLLQQYSLPKALKVQKMIFAYREKKNFSEQAMTNVARAIFDMYGLNPKRIKRVYYYGEKNSVCSYSQNGFTIRIGTYTEPIGNVFLHEMIHALAFEWKKEYGEQAYVNHAKKGSSDVNKSYDRFSKCRDTLKQNIFDAEESIKKIRDQKVKDPNEISKVKTTTSL